MPHYRNRRSRDRHVTLHMEIMDIDCTLELVVYPPEPPSWDSPGGGGGWDLMSVKCAPSAADQISVAMSDDTAEWDDAVPLATPGGSDVQAKIIEHLIGTDKAIQNEIEYQLAAHDYGDDGPDY